MATDDDLAGSLPSPPPPRPERREVAIEAAMRRFDEVDTPTRRRAVERAGWWARLDRPRVGALVAAGLMLSIGLPVWMASDHGPPAIADEQEVERRQAPPAMTPDARALPETADAKVRPMGATRPVAPKPAEPPSAEQAASATPSPVQAERDEHAGQESERAFALAPSPPPAMAVEPPSLVAVPAPIAPAEASDSSRIVVTGSRVGRERAAVMPQARSAAVPRDGNTCTVADTNRDLDRCRATIAAVVPERAVPAVRDGLSMAWRGDLDGALAAFDRAIAEAPRSAFVYRNRGLILRRMGEARRAEADERRAATLDRR